MPKHPPPLRVLAPLPTVKNLPLLLDKSIDPRLDSVEPPPDEMDQPRPILVVEDDHDVRDAMVQVLEAEGYQTVPAVDGLDAIGHLEAGLEPCLILLDLMMPRMSGWQFMEHEAVRALQTPIVVVSAYGTGEEMRAAGVTAYMRKPVDVDALLGVIARHCAAH
jgi:CheY-like chemotaxis protein